MRNEFEGSNVNPNPIDTFDLNIGTELCLILLAVMAVVLRALAAALLKLLEDRVE